VVTPILIGFSLYVATRRGDKIELLSAGHQIGGSK
jgi:hypothetical protein